MFFLVLNTLAQYILFLLWILLGSEFHITLNMSVHCCWSWDHLRIKERLGVYEETISISGLDNIAGKGREEFLAGNPLSGSSRGMKGCFTQQALFVFPTLSFSLKSRWPPPETLGLGHFSRWFLICFSLTTVLFKVIFMDAHVNIKGEYTPKVRIV